MAWGSSPVASLGAALGSNGGTSSSIDTTGADTLFLVVGSASTTTPTVSDSKTNTWDLIRSQNSGFDHLARLYRAKNATVGTGHTFTATLTSGNVGIGVLAFSGGHLSAPDDQANSGAEVFSSTASAGSITPSAANTLVVAMEVIVGDARSPSSIGESYTISVDLAESGTNFGIGMAYKIQTSATATNPTWTNDGSGLTNTAIIYSFKEAGGAPSPISGDGTLTLGAPNIDAAGLLPSLVSIGQRIGGIRVV